MKTNLFAPILASLSLFFLAAACQPQPAAPTPIREAATAKSVPATATATSPTPEATTSTLPPVVAETGAFVLPTPVSTSLSIGKIAVERREYSLAPASQDLQSCEIYDPLYTALDETRWQILRPADPDPETARQALSAWGYHCQDNVLYQGERNLGQTLGCYEQQAVFSPSRAEVAWFLPVESLAQGWLVHGNEIDRAWDQQQHFWVKPVFVGDDFLVASDIFGDQGRELLVERNGQALFTQRLQGMGDCLGTTGFLVWEAAHWGLNTEGDLIIDGEAVAAAQGYDEAFGLRVWNGKPVYFGARGSQLEIVYAGQAAPLEYDEIIHTCNPVYQAALCAQPGIETLDNRLWFFARQGDLWHYVEFELPD